MSEVKLAVFTFSSKCFQGCGQQCTVGQNHTKAGQNSISASSSNKLEKQRLCILQTLADEERSERLPLCLSMPPQRPVKELVVATRKFADFASSAFRSESSSKQSRYHYVGSIFGKYNYFIPFYVNIVILIAYHVIQRTDF
jgi:hypothetical protein